MLEGVVKILGDKMFADFVKKVPTRNYGIDGLEVHVDHTSTGTVYFVSAEKEVVFPEHSHAAQWTIVVTGSCTFIANGEKKFIMRVKRT